MPWWRVSFNLSFSLEERQDLRTPLQQLTNVHILTSTKQKFEFTYNNFSLLIKLDRGKSS